MKLLINAGNSGNAMGSTTVELIKEWGFDGARISIPLYAPEENLADIIGELADHQLLGLFIVGGWEVWIPPNDPTGHEEQHQAAHNHHDVAVQAGVVARMMKDLGCRGWIECGNEPDITENMSEQRFVDQCQTALMAVRGINLTQPFITGGVSNLSNSGGWRYLKRCLEKGLVTGDHDENVLTGVHPYRTHQEPWEEFEDRAPYEMLRDVRDLCGPYAISEIGWHTAAQTKGWWISKETFQFTDDEVKEFAQWDLDLGLTEGAELYVWYNFNDGPSDDAIDRYGIRRFATFDVAKPVVETFINWSPPI